MDTTTFLKTILPESGVKYLMRLVPRPTKDVSIHTTVATAEEAAEVLRAWDARYPEQNVYYAMASYKETLYKTAKRKSDGAEFEYVVGRTQANALHVKSLWQDWDVGKANEANSYATREDALQAIKQYLHATGLPAPIVVSSGYGIHTYWVFTEEITASEWESVACLQRTIMRHLGIKFDPMRDKDCASVLRAPGTLNKKPGQAPRMVKVARAEVNALPAQEYKRRLQKYIDAHDLTTQVSVNRAPDTPDWAKGGGNLSDMKVEYPDSFAEVAVEHCSQMREFRETGGTSEPVWYMHIGLMKHFKDGERFAHEWGANYDGYSAEETDAKLAQWAVGPTTCAEFKNKHPDGCRGCKQQCRSPIQLGHKEDIAPEHLPNVERVAETAAQIAKQVIEKVQNADGLPFGWPDRFGYNRSTDRITAKVQDPNGVWQDVGIATPLFYPIEQIRLEDGTFAFRMHMWVRGKIREFELPTKYVADKKALKMQLASNQVHVINDAATASFMSNYMNNLRVAKDEIETYRQMGWHHDFNGFLIGDTLITETEEKKVVLSQSFPHGHRSLYAPKGDIQTWARAVDKLFNQPNGEPYQFAICAAFAAPLHDLMGFPEWSGIPYAITTNESGFGKTTVNLISNAVWCDPEKAKIANSTPKAILGIASAYNCIPFLLDEVTTFLGKSVDMGDTLYALSNGRGREGMDGGGKLREGLPPWKGVCAMTGNRNILMQVTENKLNPEAIQMRVFEIDLDTYPRLTTMTKGHPDYEAHYEEHSLLAKTVCAENYGRIGPEYVRFIMKNLDEVRTKLRRVSTGMAKFMDGGDATKERFYYHLITTVLVGGYYAKKLGYINFDLNNLREWCVKHVAKMRSTVKESANTPKDNLASLLAYLSPSILITKNFDRWDSRGAHAKHQELHLGQALRTPVAGRYAIGDEKERPKLYVTVSSIREWCREHGVQFNTLRRDFIREGFIRFGTNGVNRETGAVRVAIGRGVANQPALSNPWCLEFDAYAVEGILQPHVEPAAPPTEAKASVS